MSTQCFFEEQDILDKSSSWGSTHVMCVYHVVQYMANLFVDT